MASEEQTDAARAAVGCVGWSVGELFLNTNHADLFNPGKRQDPQLLYLCETHLSDVRDFFSR